MPTKGHNRPTTKDIEVTQARVENELAHEQTEIAHDEAIRRRAYEISESDDSGTPEENWRRAEQELGGADER